MNSLNKCLATIANWQSSGYSSFKLWKEDNIWRCSNGCVIYVGGMK